MNGEDSKDDGMQCLSVSKVAGILDCSARTVRRMIHRGELPQLVKVGCRSRFFADDVKHYLESLRDKKRRAS